jgi:hypothetical protein
MQERNWEEEEAPSLVCTDLDVTRGADSSTNRMKRKRREKEGGCAARARPNAVRRINRA